MKRIEFDAACGNGNKISGFICPSDAGQECKGTIQICHGMAEYFGRYEEFVSYLNSCGWNVCGMDMMGHGATYEANKGRGMPTGYFGDCKDAAMCILKDEMTLHRIAMEHFGTSGKQILYGHSMGSFVVRNIYTIPEYSAEFDRFVFSSTMGPNPAVGVAKGIAKFMTLIGGARKEGKLIDKMAFGSYNKRVDNKRTDFDWLTTDATEVDKYIADPLCGFTFRNRAFRDLFTLVKRMQAKKTYALACKKPCLMTYGEDDPVGGYGAGVEKVAESFRGVGCPVKTINYGKYRHEIQNESAVKEKYYRDVVEFIEME